MWYSAWHGHHEVTGSPDRGLPLPCPLCGLTFGYRALPRVARRAGADLSAVPRDEAAVAEGAAAGEGDRVRAAARLRHAFAAPQAARGRRPRHPRPAA